MSEPLSAPLSAGESAPPQSRAGALARLFAEPETRRTWRVLAPLILLYGAAALGLALATGTTDQLYLATYLDRFFEAGVALAFGYFLWCLHRAGKTARAGRRLPALGRELKAGLLRRQRLAVALPLLAVFPVVMALYSSVKRMIPAIRPFDLDPLWARLDAWLHGGVQPWELLQPLLGAPQVTAVVGAFYNFSWLFLVCAVALWQAWAPRNAESRTRFFAAYILIWGLLGNLAAILLSSAGPVYYAEVTGEPGPYGPLLAYLHAAHAEAGNIAVILQDYLWQSHLGRDPAAGTGISAMPSVHIATAFLFLLVAWDSGRWLRGFFAVYLALMLLGSVHLGWHYALDGYLAIPAAWAIWWGAGRLVRAAR